MTKRFKDIEVSADIGQVRLYTTDTNYEDYGPDELLNLLNKQDQRIQELENKCEDLEQDNIYLEDRVNNQHWKLKQRDKRIQELETKLNELAFEFLKYNMISMGKAVEISEMSYHDFLKYRAEHGNPMELQL